MILDRTTLATATVDVARWLTERAPPVRTFELGTFDELWCRAQFHRISAQTCLGHAHAFTRLWQRHIEGIEEIEAGSCSVALFFASLEGDNGYGKTPVFEHLTEADWLKETSLVTDGIRKALADLRSGARLVNGARFQIPEGPLDRRRPETYWGLFEDGERVADDTTYAFLAPGCFVDGVAIRRAWNDQELLMRTPTEYVLFVWGTGA